MFDIEIIYYINKKNGKRCAIVIPESFFLTRK